MNKEPCGCCEGVEALTPLSTGNRPGLAALAYRVGTHATFLETMKARLSNLYLQLDEAGQVDRQPNRPKIYPLQNLTTREANDPAIAWLDAWATVADVLTFYQERLANEGYLLTATERRSILELARLIGYRLRPGVAASTYLAFTLEQGYEVVIPAGTRSQSLPGPGELPQSFETAEPLSARDVWNAIKPRLTDPQIMKNTTSTVYLQGVQTNLKLNDPLLIVSLENGQPTPNFLRVHQIELEPAANRTIVSLKGSLNLQGLTELLTKPPTTPFPFKQVGPPELLSPTKEAPDVSITEPIILTWQASENLSGSVTYDLALDFNNPPTTIEAQNLKDLAYTIPQPEGGRTYYWQVTAKDHISQTPSEIRSFSTKQAHVPADGAIDVPTTQLFQWIGNLTTTYGFALGTTDPPPKLEDKTGTSYKPKQPLNPGTPYFWQIIDPTDPTPGPVWKFTTVDEPVPKNGADEGISTTPTLQWAQRGDPPYTVAYSTKKSATTGKLISPTKIENLQEARYNFPSDKLQRDTTYYWQVTDKTGSASPVWSFTTGGTRHKPLSPTDGAHNIPITQTFTWESSPPTEKYKIYLGTQSPPQLIESDHSGASYTASLEPGTRYYWRITATDETVDEAAHPVWEFTTLGLSKADEKRQSAYEDILKHIKNRLLASSPADDKGTAEDDQPLLTWLANTKLPTSDLEQYIKIETPALARVQEIFEAFAALEYPQSSLDFSQLAEWIESVNSELTDISKQLELRRSARVSAKRLFENQSVRPEIVDRLIQYINAETLPSFIKNSRVAKEEIDDPELDKLLKEPGGDIPELVKFLSAGQEEDEKIIQAKAQTRRVADLWAVFARLDDRTQVKDWLDKMLNLLRDVIQNTSSEPRVKEAGKRFLDRLQAPPARQPRHPLRLERTVDSIFSATSDMVDSIFSAKADLTTRLLTTLQPQLKGIYYQAWANAEVEPLFSQQGVQALRVKAAPYGAKLSEREPEYAKTEAPQDPAKITAYIVRTLKSALGVKAETKIEEIPLSVLTLDAEYNQIVAGSWIVIEWAKFPTEADEKAREHQRTCMVEQVQTVSKPDYGRVTQLILDREWLKKEDFTDKDGKDQTDLSILRNAVVYAQSEPLELAEEPILDEVEGREIRLDGLYNGLETGRWLIVSGERSDIPGTSGVRANELVMLAGVKQVVQQYNLGPKDNPKPIDIDTPHTTIQIAQEGLAYKYKPDTVVIYGNVVKATHGETRQEVLGSGNGSQVRQSFLLKQSPLTYLAAATPQGIQSTLEVRVNEVLWHEVDNLIWLEANDRGYITQTDDESKTTVIFGDGWHGARLYTGVENIKAVYRTGIGKAGNVAAEQISLLATKPLGVKKVINPLPASGGADREGRDQARRNAPVAVMALDRLVSLQDYEDFARTYAGISKAKAIRLSDGRREIIHLTIAGLDDIPINVDSDLYQGLSQALRQFGALRQPTQVDMRELVLLMIEANVRLLPDYSWELVAPHIRAALLETFSFEDRQLGQDVLLSEVLSVVQHVPGVAYVDVDILDGISADTPPEELETLAKYWNSAEYKLKERLVVETARIQTMHEVKRNNETLSSVAARYADITSTELLQWNKKIITPLFPNNPLPIREPLPIGTLLSLNSRRIRPAQLAYLSPDLPDMLILKEVT